MIYWIIGALYAFGIGFFIGTICGERSCYGRSEGI